MNKLDNSLSSSLTDSAQAAANPPVVAAAVLPDSGDPAYRAKATAAAVQFESFFIGQMLHQMRAGISDIASKDSPVKDQGNSDMIDLADNLVADKMAGQRAFGIADVILRQLLPAAVPATHGGTSASKIASHSDNVAGAFNKQD
jgi:flagellar protein FlgJ